MYQDYLHAHHIPHPAHIDEWIELEHARILRFKGDVNSATLPSILEFKILMDRTGIPVKNLIIDGKKVAAVDSAAVASLLIEIQQEHQKIAVIHPPPEFRSYLEILRQDHKIMFFATEQEAVAALNTNEAGPDYLPRMKRTFKKNKSLSLLISLLLFLVALPFYEDNMMGIIYLAFFSFMLLSGIYAVSYNMRHVAAGVLLATPILVTAWSNAFIMDRQILNAQMVFLIIFLVYTLAVIIKHVLAVKKVTINELYGAICVYIMVGMTFGVIYALLQSFDPSALGLPEGEGDPKMTAFFYFSFVSMSSTGFSGFTAASPLARSIVMVQVIIGVMYISALMGKLVSANTSKDDVEPEEIDQKLKIDVWHQSLTESFFRRRPILLVISMCMLNYSTSVLMTVLNWPFFMDSWGTSLAVVLGGVLPGLMSGVIYNLIMAWTFWGPASWVWMFCNITVALLTWYFIKRKWIDLHKPAKLLGAGVITGIINSMVVAFITAFADMPIYQGTMAVYRFFYQLTGDSAFASLAEKAAVEVADKTIAFLLVAVAVIFIRDFFNWNSGDKKETGPFRLTKVNK